jgi:uncharacterized protein YgiM (DUF1202 family)
MPRITIAPRTKHSLHPLIAGAIALPLACLAAGEASAKAPPLATTVFDAEARSAPGLDAEVVAVIPSGTEVELTGEAAPGYLAINDANDVVWVPAQYLALSDRPGIDTAVTVVDTELLDAPMRDAGVLGTVPEGEAVILTGATLDGYDASSYEGVGGWIQDRDLTR